MQPLGSPVKSVAEKILNFLKATILILKATFLILFLNLKATILIHSATYDDSKLLFLYIFAKATSLILFVMIVNSQELIQSYVITTAKYDFSVYEKRIMYRLIQMAQRFLDGKKLDKNFRLDTDLFGRKVVQMPISAFLKDEKDKNYTQAKKALRDLESKKLEYEDEKVWELIRLIILPKIEKYSNIVQFEIEPKIWLAITQFSKGFSKYELKYAMSFNSVYAMRFYELFSNNLRPMTISIDELKKRFKIEDKYKNKPTNFIKKVIVRAKQELDEKAPYSFDFVVLKTGRKITAIKFLPYRIPENEDVELETKKLKKQVSPNFYLPLEITRYLQEKFNFDRKGIVSNLELLKTAYLQFDLLQWLAELYPRASRANNSQAYVIGALRTYLKNLEEKKGKKEATSAVDDLAAKIARMKKG